MTAASDQVPCGSVRAYSRHVAAGVPHRDIDPACREAMARYKSAWQQRRKARIAAARARLGAPRQMRRGDAVVVPPPGPVDLALAAAGCAGQRLPVAETAALLGVSVDRARALIAAGRAASPARVGAR